MRSLLAVIVVARFLTGCVVAPVSYVPTTGKVGSQSGTSCVFLLLGLIRPWRQGRNALESRGRCGQSDQGCRSDQLNNMVVYWVQPMRYGEGFQLIPRYPIMCACLRENGENGTDLF